MSYTALVVDDQGVRLRRFHVERLARSGLLREEIGYFLDGLAPGIHVVRVVGKSLQATPRAASRAFDGMPVRVLESPYVNVEGSFAKPAPPSRYDAVRSDGIATLLTNAAGDELWESCAASIVAWDGDRFVLAPPDRPRVVSVMEQAVVEAAEYRYAPIPTHGEWPLALLNAVVGHVVPVVPGRLEFPASARDRLRELHATIGR